MIFFRKLYRFTRVCLTFAYGMIELVIKRPHTRSERAGWLSVFCNRLLRSTGVTFNTVGHVPTHGAVITNHLTYVDIILHSAMRPCVFVSKAELRQTPVLGWVSMMAGTIYVERGAGGSAARAAEIMAKGFRDGLPVVFFPEGTTGVGDVPAMPFKSGLLAQALEAEQPITAGFISYTLQPEDIAAGKTTRDDVHWGTQGMLEHLWNLLGLKSIHGTATFVPEPIAFTPAALANRKIAAAEARAAVIAVSGRPGPGAAVPGAVIPAPQAGLPELQEP